MHSSRLFLRLRRFFYRSSRRGHGISPICLQVFIRVLSLQMPLRSAQTEIGIRLRRNKHEPSRDIGSAKGPAYAFFSSSKVYVFPSSGQTRFSLDAPVVGILVPTSPKQLNSSSQRKATMSLHAHSQCRGTSALLELEASTSLQTAAYTASMNAGHDQYLVGSMTMASRALRVPGCRRRGLRIARAARCHILRRSLRLRSACQDHVAS